MTQKEKLPVGKELVALLPQRLREHCVSVARMEPGIFVSDLPRLPVSVEHAETGKSINCFVALSVNMAKALVSGEMCYGINDRGVWNETSRRVVDCDDYVTFVFFDKDDNPVPVTKLDTQNTICSNASTLLFRIESIINSDGISFT